MRHLELRNLAAILLAACVCVESRIWTTPRSEFRTKLQRLEIGRSLTGTVICPACRASEILCRNFPGYFQIGWILPSNRYLVKAVSNLLLSIGSQCSFIGGSTAWTQICVKHCMQVFFNETTTHFAIAWPTSVVTIDEPCELMTFCTHRGRAPPTPSAGWFFFCFGTIFDRALRTGQQ